MGISRSSGLNSAVVPLCEAMVVDSKLRGSLMESCRLCCCSNSWLLVVSIDVAQELLESCRALPLLQSLVAPFDMYCRTASGLMR